MSFIGRIRLLGSSALCCLRSVCINFASRRWSIRSRRKKNPHNHVNQKGTGFPVPFFCSFVVGIAVLRSRIFLTGRASLYTEVSVGQKVGEKAYNQENWQSKKKHDAGFCRKGTVQNRADCSNACNQQVKFSWQEREQADSVFGEKPLHQTKRNKQSNQQNSRHIRYLFSLKYYLIKEWQKTDQCNRFFAFWLV